MRCGAMDLVNGGLRSAPSGRTAEKVKFWETGMLIGFSDIEREHNRKLAPNLKL